MQNITRSSTLRGLFSPHTPPINGAESIATLESVTLNGSKQWITLRGQNASNPVLLYLAGGPGGSDLASTRKYLHALEQHFVVVNWDQPGSGKSFNAVNKSELTPERYLADARDLVTYLQERFNQQKIYLMGHSWGSLLGIWLIQRHPECFHAYVGVAQMVNPTESDRAAYRLALELADDKARQRLEQVGPPPYLEGDIFSKYAVYAMVLHRHNPHKSKNQPTLFRDVLSAPEYSLMDKINLFRGQLRSFNVVYPQLSATNLLNEQTRFEVPVYFVLGRRDVNVMPQFAEDYFNRIEAPRKQCIWFEDAAHLAHFEEPERFKRFILERILA